MGLPIVITDSMTCIHAAKKKSADVVCTNLGGGESKIFRATGVDRIPRGYKLSGPVIDVELCVGALCVASALLDL